VPGAGMAEVLGLKEISVDPAAGGSLRIVRAHHLVRVPEGTTIPVSKYLETTAVSPGAVVAGEFEGGKPAIVANAYGKGAALYAATMLCHSYDVAPQPAVRELLAGIAEATGVARPVRIQAVNESRDLEARMLTGQGGGRVAVILNHGSNSLDAVASFEAAAGKTLIDLLQGTRVSVPGSGSVKLRLQAFGVRLLMVES